MTKMSYLAVVFVAVMVMAARTEQATSECKQEKDALVGACATVALLGQSPSETCCERVRAADEQCICSYVTPKIANLINVERVIKEIEGCQRTVPRNFKCGSITTPAV